MIKTLRGKIIIKEAPFIIIECFGVGYEVCLPMSNFNKLPEEEQEVFVYTHQRILDDKHLLYGFIDNNELKLFKEIIKVDKVGPQIALAILSYLSSYDFINAIINNDDKRLQKVPGIGKKTAERIIVELKDKPIVKNNNLNILSNNNINDEYNKAIDALIFFDIKKEEATKIIDKIYKEELTSDELLRIALNHISKGK